MSFKEALPPREKGPDLGVSFSLRIVHGSVQPRLTFNAAAQDEYFGGPVKGHKARVLVGTGEDEGKIKIVLSKDGMLTFQESMRGSVSLAVRSWDGLPNNGRKAERVLRVSKDGDGLLIHLPDMHKAPVAKPRGGKRSEETPEKDKPFVVRPKPPTMAEAGKAMTKATRG